VATFTVTQFVTADGAERVLATLTRLQEEELITIEDAAIVTWPPGADGPQTTQLRNVALSGTLGGAFWGMLFGIIFTVPLIGLAVGAASGAIAGVFVDVGIDDAFIKRIREQVTPGTSALFLMTSGAVRDKVAEELRGELGNVTLLHTNLSPDQEQKMRDTLAAEAEPPGAA
jgi:uncharacterized membrane protein